MMNLFMKKRKTRTSSIADTKMRIGDEIDFMAKEAYKLLRTNLLFMLNKEENVIGITSSISGEGKSLTSINLAISFSSMGKKVLLIECDMRKPVFGKYFHEKTESGLSNVLAEHCSVNEVIYKSYKFENLYYISSGDIPPNPTELLASTKMDLLIKTASKNFDVVILDAPPVTAVADAVIVSKFTKGVIVVVREDYVEKDELLDTIRQLQMAEANILGFVYNASGIAKNKYYKKGYSYYKDKL